jgi:divalent metal cation (Fe/Co/Zn/Cd) transporter
VEGVMSAHQIRVRPSGNRFFIDLHICVARNVGFETSHQIAEAVEAAVRKAVENSDVVVHVDPRPAGDEELSERARVIAANLGVPVHDVHFHKQDDKLHLSLDIEVDASLPLDKAHDVSKRLEQALRAGIPEVHHVHTHIEPHRPEEVKTASLGHDSSRLVEELKKAARTVKGIVDCHEVEIEDAGAKELIVSLHCTFAGGASIEQAHQAASEVERKLRSKYPAIQRVLVHTEPRPHRDPARRSLGEGGVEKKRH